MLGLLVGVWWIGVLATLIVMPYRCGLGFGAYATVFAHDPSRRNGIPWLLHTLGKALAWPVVLYQWNQAGRPSSPVLYGPAAAEALGIDPSSLTYGTNAFATKWERPSGTVGPRPTPGPSTQRIGSGGGVGATWTPPSSPPAPTGPLPGAPTQSARVLAAGAVLDDAWFDRWFDSILRDSGVASDDGQNRLQLTVFTLGTIDSAAATLFEQRNDPGSRATYDRLCASGAGPGARVRFLLDWNPTARDLLAQRLDKHHDLLVQGGRTHGRMRLFPSPCCGQPTEYSLTDRTPFCSECRSPV